MLQDSTHYKSSFINYCGLDLHVLTKIPKAQIEKNHLNKIKLLAVNDLDSNFSLLKYKK